MHFHFGWSSVILRLNAYELLAFVYIFVECTLPRQSSIANRVLHKRQRKLIDRHVKIFLTTYFRTTPMADVNFTSLVTSLITCYHCVSFTVALMICKLQRILKGFTSLVAQRVFTSMMRIMQPANRGLAVFRAAGPRADYFGFGCERTIGAWIHVCNTTMQYGFVLHCCDVMALCTAS